MRSPIIGITTYSRSEAGEFTLPAAYIDAVQLAGGLPLLLPPLQADPTPFLEVIDGLIFAGGGDIAPERYDGDHHHTIYLVDEERDNFELALAQQVLQRDIPVLGICRGMQLLSVATGAALVPHVPDVYGDQVAHRLDNPRRPITHPAQIEAETRLAKILQVTNLVVMSWHHQAVRTLPDCWQAAARADDGVVEAVEHRHHPWLVAVQWHPELSPQDPVHQRLFQGLVEAARERKQSSAAL
ncbi:MULTISPECIES: gamma-glutamyl-gamma-aminobutyrate hydrolase family protein [unclassified Leptolyngbya]|uniref:gamma-glutamyl-gamma-aminobutyrate hydrolase family protein n=1 Tax=unclassified Leptolyngbya TaxID=2650499 RepID=UPI001683E389|nr:MULTISPECIES: gamma-glutamyl-gamma-aminobutyrate hydrolase family protein [unclassified Leptolyngbya]MBD1911773.1 gamma-glutamyl-gamma-aminobutyrate hydrolase family protein [Leptolyngbya sp. FACHB-8]MBD2153337.1 gamma-glutamyl-gamma-aminobutyrate hydrolase family protein [Leptolyngbya sp. FACHB-16]